MGVIGEGAFGEVILAKYYFGNNETYAIKCIDKKFLKKNNKTHEIANEVLTLKYLENTYVCKYISDFEDELKYYIVLEYCPYGTLESYIEKKKQFTKEEIR